MSLKLGLKMEVFTPPIIQEKRPPGRQPKLSVEMQIMIAKKVTEEGMSYREAAKVFNVSHGSIYAYKQKYKDGNLKKKRKQTASKYKERVEDYRHKAEVKELKHEIANLYLENLLLKKALEHSVRRKSEDLSVITSESLAQSKEGAK